MIKILVIGGNGQLAQCLKNVVKNNDELKLIEKEYNNHKAVMYYTPSCSKSNINRKQYIFVNKRIILDRSLTSFVLKLFQNFWGIKNYGDYCLFISIPTQSLDVNVHPSKTHVRFEERSVVFSTFCNSKL